MTQQWSDVQRKFIDLLFSPLIWREAGFDRLKITHRKDGRFQISWQYQQKNNHPPYTVNDSEGFMYLSYIEMHQVLRHLKKVLTEHGAL